ncbi:transglycosylase SLT domain-containing protein [Streptomyces sp. NBC_01435]|uniref:transglycosylase SLT domain-containing protein n=1 Tax=Streptomyces sp. NBC_01435 TaxID=2903865 RepID=UPI003FCED854
MAVITGNHDRPGHTTGPAHPRTARGPGPVPPPPTPDGTTPPHRSHFRMTTQTRTPRTARIRTLAVTALATTAAAAAALTLTSTSAQAAELKQTAPTVKTAPASDNLDGWIKESLAIMKAKGIPGSYEGLHRNIMRESGGNPNAHNGWDSNAQKGTPSKGLLQVIQPTFNAYHVAGTAHDLTDPVANITAAANYAANRYGSIDNVNSAY